MIKLNLEIDIYDFIDDNTDLVHNLLDRIDNGMLIHHIDKRLDDRILFKENLFEVLKDKNMAQKISENNEEDMVCWFDSNILANEVVDRVQNNKIFKDMMIDKLSNDYIIANNIEELVNDKNFVKKFLEELANKQY